MLQKTFSDLKQDLKKQYYCKVPFAISHEQIQDAVEAFMEFLKQPNNIKHHIHYKISDIHRRGDVGFIHRDPEDDIYNDSKDYFHYHDSIREQYADFLHAHPGVNNFIEKASPIWKAAQETAQNILKPFDADSPGLYERIFGAKLPHVILRFICYNWESAQKRLAKAHYDAGSFTLALAESERGLRIGIDEDSLTLVEHHPNEALFFLSKNFSKLINSTDYKPAWHDVIQLNDQIIGKPYARWSVVCFLDANDIEAESRESTHTCSVAAG